MSTEQTTIKEAPHVRKWILQFLESSPHLTLEDLARKYWIDKFGRRHNLYYTGGFCNQARKMLREQQPKPIARGIMSTAKRKAEQRKKIPIVKGFIIERGNPTFNFWCPFCKCNHIHNWSAGSGGKEHRVAHCYIDSSPFRETGYYLQLFTAKELEGSS